MPSNESIPIEWTGDDVTDLIPIIPPNAENGTFYSAFRRGSLHVTVGQFVHISVDGRSRDSYDRYDIARVMFLYHKSSSSPSEAIRECSTEATTDDYRACVQWYSWPTYLPPKCITDDIVLHFEKEVIEDFRPYDVDVPISCIAETCTVIMGIRHEDPHEIILDFAGDLTDDTVYACRYRLVYENKKQYYLQSVLLNAPSEKTISEIQSALQDASDTPVTKRKPQGSK